MKKIRLKFAVLSIFFVAPHSNYISILNAFLVVF